MHEICRIPDKHLDEFIRIAANAYPGMKIITEEDRKKQREKFIKQNKDTRNSTWGYYRDGKLLGGLRLHDFTMTLHGVNIPAGGAGYLAVNLAHKKEHIAKELMLFFFRQYRKKKASMALLWPFRPDFYRKMGCGYGGKVHLYRVKPEHLPKGRSKAHVRALTRDDLPALVNCFNRYAAKMTGMIEDTLISREWLFDEYPRFKWVGYERGGVLQGYLMFEFTSEKLSNFLNNNLRVIELVYETPEVLLELMTFLHSQADQINRVLITTADDNFHHLLFDPRNDSENIIPLIYHESHTSGVGIMYRTLSIPYLLRALRNHDFGGQTCIIKLSITDSFLSENEGSYIIQFENGQATVRKRRQTDVEVAMDISDFSSLVIGAVDMRSLYAYSRVEISNVEYLDILNRLFATDHKPVCLTAF